MSFGAIRPRPAFGLFRLIDPFVMTLHTLRPAQWTTTARLVRIEVGLRTGFFGRPTFLVGITPWPVKRTSTSSGIPILLNDATCISPWLCGVAVLLTSEILVRFAIFATHGTGETL